MAFPSMLVLVQWIHAEVLMNPVALSLPANNFKIFIFHLAFIFCGRLSIFENVLCSTG